MGLQQLVVDTIENFVDRYAPGFWLPRTFGGHVVGPDAIADLAHTLGLVAECGVTHVAGTPIAEAIATVLSQVDGPETHSFFSYRVAETLVRYGPFHDNALLATMTPAQRDNLAVACDSTELLVLLDGLLPRNYLAVLARCELGRQRLGILPPDNQLDDLVSRTRSMLAANVDGFHDDSNDGTGRFDIYTADIYLFCEPLADLLGDTWTTGATNAVRLVESVATRDGSSVTWGRSTGVLSIALTIELAALVLSADPSRPLSEDPQRWADLAANAADGLGDWFSGGVIGAHQFRSTEGYRGPQRRLQMTFDVLGKLAEAERRFRTLPSSRPRAADSPTVFPDHDEVLWFSERAAVWSHRSPQLAFALPFVGGRSSDYLPAPHNPGLFETPVDSTQVCFLPVGHRAGTAISPQLRFAPGEVPSHLAATDVGIVVEYDSFVAARAIDSPPGAGRLAGTRRAVYEVDGAWLRVRETLAFEQVPAAVTITVPSTAGRPLAVQVNESAGARVRTVDVSGMKEWQTQWSAIDTVTEIELTPAAAMTFEWKVRAKPRVAVTLNDHHYIRTVYDPIADRIAERTFTSARDDVDVAHLHWPEWCFGYGISFDEHARIARRLRLEGTKVAWTQHNLTPHLDEPDVYNPIYQLWAESTDLAVHHSHWGMEQVLARYDFAPSCRHEVIAHPHFGPAMTPNAYVGRDEAAARLGLDDGRERPPLIRIGIMGAPRKEKDLQLVIDALRASDRDDIQLVIWSMSFHDDMPDDPRIVAEHYANADRSLYDLRLAACDAIALPFTGHTMLATGTTSDLVATSTPGLITDWPYLSEYMGDGGIAMGTTVEEWTAAIDSLDPQRLATAAAASGARRDRFDPATIASATASAIEALGIKHV